METDASAEVVRSNHSLAERALEVFLVVGALCVPLAEGAVQVSCALAMLLVLLLRGASILPRHRLGRAFLVLLGGWVILGTSSAIAHGNAIRTSSLNYALMGFALILGLELSRHSDRERLVRLGRALLLGAAIAAVLGALQLILGEFPGESLLADGRIRGQRYIPGTRRLAATGSLQHRLKMSEVWVAILAAGVALRVWGVSVFRVVTLIVTVFVFIALTYAKAAAGAALVALFAYALLRFAPRLGRWLYGMGGLAIASAVPVALWLGARTTPTLPVPQGSFEVRPWLWSLAYDLFIESPVFGSGLGTYYGQAKPRVVSGYDVHSFGAHQELLTVTVETGIVGVVLFGAMLAVGATALLRAHGTALSRPQRALVTFALLCFSAYAVLGVVHDFLFNPTTAILFWTSIGVGLGADPREPASEG